MKKTNIVLSVLILCCLLFVFFIFKDIRQEARNMEVLTPLTTTEETAALPTGKSAVEQKLLALASKARLAAAGVTKPVKPSQDSVNDGGSGKNSDNATTGAASTSKTKGAKASTAGLADVSDLSTDTEAAIDNTIAWAKGSKYYVLYGDALSAAGTASADWLAIALGRYGYPDQSEAFLAKLQSHVTSAYGSKGYLDANKATEWHRITLAVLAMGGDPTAFGSVNLIADGVYNCVESPWKQGLDGAVFGLIVLDTKGYAVPADAKYQRDDIIGHILAEQNGDGGFALGSETSDPNMTAMVLQALAPYADSTTVYDSGKSPSQVVAEAVAWLAGAQNSAGDFSSSGTATVESTAQVIIALCSLGIDPATDSRFVKNGNSVMTGLGKYYNSNGSFGSNGTATDQARLALIAYYRYVNGFNTLYNFKTEAGRSDAQLLSLIHEIGTLPTDSKDVKLEHEAAVLSAARKYNMLSAADQKKIKNNGGELLTKALAKINRLKDEILNPKDPDDPKDPEDPGDPDDPKEPTDPGPNPTISDTAKALDAEITEKISPINITLKDRSMVYNLWERYQSLSDSDKAGIANVSDLELSKKIVDGLAKSIVIKEVFELLAGNDIDYKITGIIDNAYEYTITFNGKEISNPMDFDARVLFTAANSGAIAKYASNPSYIQFVHNGNFPGKAKVTMSVKAKDGDYLLYYYDAGSKNFNMVKKVSIRGGGLSFEVNKGGDYFLTTKQTSKSTRSYGTADFKGGVVPASVFKEIQGQNVNLVLEGKTEDGIPYTITFNGKDIKKPVDFNMQIAFTSDAKEYIEQLAENPFIIHFENEGELPGEALVELQKVPLEDDTYLFVYYHPDEMKAEFIQKVDIKAGETRFIITHTSDYFIAKKVKTGSLLDGGTETTAGPVAAVDDGTKSYLPWYIGGGALLVILAVLAILLYRRSRKKKLKNDEKGVLPHDEIGKDESE